MEKNNINCSGCQKSYEECLAMSISKDPICSTCIKCKFCAKKRFCSDCSTKCKRCEKVLIKNNWPEDIIHKGNMCDKCYHLCIKCGKYTRSSKAIYKSTKRWCVPCFVEKYRPKDSFEYKLVTKQQDRGMLFLSWRKTHETKTCEKCDKNFKCLLNRKQKECPKCLKKKEGQDKKNNGIGTDPSTGDKKYKVVIDGNRKRVWELSEERKICIRCCTSVWIRVENLKKMGLIFFCQNCSPNDEKKKFKYDKEKQRWIVMQRREECGKCRKEKWLKAGTDICPWCQKKLTNNNNANK